MIKESIVLLLACISFFLCYSLFWKGERYVQNGVYKALIFLVWICGFYFVGVYCLERRTIPIDNDIIFGFLLMFLVMLVYNILIIAFNTNRVVDITSPRQRVIQIFLYLSLIFLVFSFLNYLIYWDNPSAFSFEQDNLNWFDIAVSFLYYSFSTSLTYSASGIEPLSSFSKIISMLQIAIFYVVLGESIFSVLQEREK